MEVKNCKRCGRVFNVLSGEDICPVCKKSVEEEFAKVKEYVLENKGASVEKVAKDNDVNQIWQIVLKVLLRSQSHSHRRLQRSRQKIRE